MLDGLSLDQLRIFQAAVDEGSFSAAARKLRRTQSAVSETMANLEAQLGVVLFDRSARYPRLTTEGAVLLADARAIVAGVNGLKARAKGIAGGLEPELTAVIDVFFPITAFAKVAREFRESFSATPLRLYVEALGATVQPVMDGRASFGLVGSLPTLPAGLTAERITSVDFVMVAAADHPLAAHRGLIPKVVLAEHVQLVLTDRSDLSAGREFGVMSPSTWRLGDLFAKHAFLLSGLGWGGMPLHIVRQDIDEGRLVILSIEDIPEGGLSLPMSAVYRTSDPPGPAGRWMIERLRRCPNQVFSQEAVDVVESV
ncbi:LysR family transcriptional regulator [Methylobacterium sp.]|uniref:LysR family transcriptional regulator n=1 Tax=Methylobacterium sp. TaxID=409 RepID=UPI0025F44FA8|nr:LysR family transcriptional regulator [Methylobacterium sp.]MBY0257093.1 LysR family transcriptional regulator [Methylobacterium sp.]